jgi:hypothetical protein
MEDSEFRMGAHQGSSSSRTGTVMIVIIPATFPNPLYCVPFYISPPIEGPILPIGPVLQSIRSETSAGGDVNLPVNIVDVAIAKSSS